MNSTAVAGMLGLAAIVVGCGSAVPSAIEPDAPDHGLNAPECKLTRKEARPLVVEWPVEKRGRLEAALRRQPLVVKAEGCSIEPLWDCVAPGAYNYQGLTRKHDAVRIRDANELYGQLPVGAASLEARLAQHGEIHVSMAVVGRYEFPSVVEAATLTGNCAGATHIVSGVSVGAFELASVTGADAKGSVQALGATAGGASRRDHEVLSRDGDIQSCDKSLTDDTDPPEGCGASLRIDITPLALPASREAIKLAIFKAEQKIMKECAVADEWFGTSDAQITIGPTGAFTVDLLEGPQFGQASCVKSLIEEQSIPPFSGEPQHWQVRVMLWECALSSDSPCEELKPINWHPRWPKD